MELFDVCVIGNDISAYVAVATLEKSGHKVAHIKAFDHYLEEQFTPSKGLPDMNHEEGLIGSEGITQEILSFLGLDSLVKSQTPPAYKEILADGRVLTRHYDKAAFRIYLIRHFPQHAKAIERWMEDIHTVYEAYKASLNPTQYETVSNTFDTLGKWSGSTLDTWLNGYFQDAALKESVQVFTDLYPSQLNEISTVEYLMYYFTAFEENGRVTSFSFTDWIKSFKKQANVTHFTSALLDVIFDENDYTVTLKNKDTFKTRFLMGQVHRSDAESTTYRWIDIECDSHYYEKTFKVPIHFRDTPLFESLKVVPFHTMNPKKKGKLRLEVVSQADSSLLVTYMDRHFKGFESAIKTITERQPFRKNIPHLYESYAQFHTLEVREDLWDEPKWMQIPLNESLKRPILMRLLKGMYFALEMDQFIREETKPKRSSLMVQAVEQLMLVMSAKKRQAIELKAGYQTVAMSVNKQGATRIDTAETPVQVDIKALLNAKETPIQETDIEAEDSLKSWFLKAIQHPVKTDSKKWPLIGMLLNAAVLMVLWGVRDDSFAAFGFGAWLIFKETIYLMRYRTFTRFESILGISLVLLGFFQVLWPFDMGAFWVFTGITLMIVNEHRLGLIDREFSFDPIHQELSNLYLKAFNRRMSHAISLTFVIMGLSYFIDSLFAPILLAIASMIFILWTYYEDKRNYIDYHGEELI